MAGKTVERLIGSIGCLALVIYVAFWVLVAFALLRFVGWV